VVALAIALPGEFQDLGVMDQPVDRGQVHHVIGDDAVPGAKEVDSK
jgi:hypothetical protein